MYKKLTVALVAAFALGAVACNTAFAEEYGGPTWLIKEAAAKENVVVHYKSATNLQLEDTKEGSIECKVTGEGKIGPAGKDEVTALTAGECKSVKTCEAGTASAKAINLPWKTQLGVVEEGETEGPIRDTISSSGAGAPGWDMKCKVLGMEITDECTGETTEGVENVSGGVDTIFDSESAHLKCSLGGPGSGVLSGTQLDESPESGKLSMADLTMTVNVVAASGGVTIGPEAKSCTFTATGQWCEIKLANSSGFTVKIIEKEIAGTSRYSLTKQECTLNLVLGTLVECLDRVELKATFATGWTNTWLARVENSFGLRGTSTIHLAT